MQSASMPADHKEEKLDPVFVHIYNIAKEVKNESDEAGDKKLLQLRRSIDIKDNKGLTVAGKLASEGNHKAVAFLMRYGADIHEIAKGAAFGGRYGDTEYYWKRFGARIDFIAAGAAMRGDRQVAEYVRTKFDADINPIILGAAIKGDLEYVDYLLSVAAAEYQDFLEKSDTDVNLPSTITILDSALDSSLTFSLHSAVRGLIAGGYAEYVSEWHKKCDALEKEIRNKIATNVAYKLSLIDLQAYAFPSARWDFDFSGYAEFYQPPFAAVEHFLNKESALYFLVSRKDHIDTIAADVRDVNSYKTIALNHKILIEQCLAEDKTSSNVVLIVDDKSENAHKKLAAFYSLKLQVEYPQNAQAEHKVAHVKKTGLVKVLKLEKALSSYDVSKLPQQVRTMRRLLPKYNYAQSAALVFGGIGLQIWYLQFWQLMASKNLNKDLFWYISTFLAPLGSNESAGLYEKFVLNSLQHFLIEDLGRLHERLMARESLMSRVCLCSPFIDENQEVRNINILFENVIFIPRNLIDMNILLEEEIKEKRYGEEYQRLLERHQKRVVTHLSFFNQNKEKKKKEENKQENKDKEVKEFNLGDTRFNDNYFVIDRNASSMPEYKALLKK